MVTAVAVAKRQQLFPHTHSVVVVSIVIIISAFACVSDLAHSNYLSFVVVVRCLFVVFFEQLVWTLRCCQIITCRIDKYPYVFVCVYVQWTSVESGDKARLSQSQRQWKTVFFVSCLRQPDTLSKPIYHYIVVALPMAFSRGPYFECALLSLIHSAHWYILRAPTIVAIVYTFAVEVFHFLRRVFLWICCVVCVPSLASYNPHISTIVSTEQCVVVAAAAADGIWQCFMRVFSVRRHIWHGTRKRNVHCSKHKT